MHVERFLLSTETVTAMMQHIINWNHYNYYNNIAIYVYIILLCKNKSHVCTKYAICCLLSEKEVNFKHEEILQ